MFRPVRATLGCAKVATILLLAAASAGCPRTCPPDPTPPPTTIPISTRQPFFVGVAPGGNAAVTDAYAGYYAIRYLGTSAVLTFSVNWSAMLDPDYTGTAVEDMQTLVRNMVNAGAQPYTQIDFWGGPGRDDIQGLPALVQDNPTFSNPAVCDAFTRFAEAAMGPYAPRFLALGIETNYYKHRRGVPRPDYQAWLDCYHHAYDVLKPLNFGVQRIGTTFLLEDLDGSLGQSPADFEQIFDYDPNRMDFYGFGSFPGINAPGVIQAPYAKPADVPDDYWRRLGAAVGPKPIAIETAWSADCNYGGLPSMQAEWVNRAIELYTALPAANVNPYGGLYYYFMSDPPAGAAVGYFGETGLMTREGALRPAYGLWTQLVAWSRPY